jgi:hypothetical protein
MCTATRNIFGHACVGLHEKNPLFAAKPRFRELWGREKMGKGEKKRGKKKREREERRITVAATDNDGTNALSLKPQHDPAVNL